MKPFITIILLAFTVMICKAQITVTGKVIDSATAKPIPGVSILVANTTLGTQTNAQGAFTLGGLTKNNYTIIASIVGYKARQAVITPENAASVIFIMAEKTRQLKEVTINAGDWQRNLTRFKNEFIGTTNAKDVSVLNPDILYLHFDRDANRLSASTDEFLEIQNNQLGYKLRFLVKDFWADYTTMKTHYSGQVVFELLKGKVSDEKRWAKNRKEAYEGSFRHFLTSLYANTIKSDGFDIFQFIRTINLKRPRQTIIDNKLAYFKKQVNERSNIFAGDSLRKWMSFKSMPLQDESLGRNYTANNLINVLADSTARIDFPNSLYIVYKKKHLDDTDDLMRFSSVAGDHEIAALTIKDPSVPIIFNKDGILLTHDNLFFEGAWNSRIIDMLPSDYKP